MRRRRTNSNQSHLNLTRPRAALRRAPESNGGHRHQPNVGLHAIARRTVHRRRCLIIIVVIVILVVIVVAAADRPARAAERARRWHRRHSSRAAHGVRGTRTPGAQNQCTRVEQQQTADPSIVCLIPICFEHVSTIPRCRPRLIRSLTFTFRLCLPHLCTMRPVSFSGICRRPFVPHWIGIGIGGGGRFSSLSMTTRSSVSRGTCF